MLEAVPGGEYVSGAGGGGGGGTSRAQSSTTLHYRMYMFISHAAQLLHVTLRLANYQLNISNKLLEAGLLK